MKQDRVVQIANMDEISVGSYTCHASNEAGNLTASLQLELIGRCIALLYAGSFMYKPS